MRRTLMFPGLVVLLFLLVGLIAGAYVYQERGHSVRERFFTDAVTESRTLGAQLNQNLAQLRAMASYFSASERVRKQEFEQFSEGVLSKSLQGQTIVWTSVVPAAELDRFVSQIRADNPETHGDFSLNLADKPIEDYLVPGLGALVGTYSRPSDGRSYSGWVLDPEGQVASTMLRAVRNGRPDISDIHVNAGEDPSLADKPCVVMTMPVFSGEGHSHVLKGLLSAIVTVPSLMGAEANGSLNPDLRVGILDRDFNGTVVYDLTADHIISEEDSRSGAMASRVRQMTEPMEVVNRQWTLVVGPAEGAFQTPVWPSLMTVAIVLTLGTCIAYVLWRHRARLELAQTDRARMAHDTEMFSRRANQLEAELRETAESLDGLREKCDAAVTQARQDRRLLESVLNRLPQGICILDAEARLVAWNRHVAALLDISDGTLKADSPAEDMLQEVAEARPLGGTAKPVTSWRAFFSRAASNSGEARLEFKMRSGIMLSALRVPSPVGGCMLILSRLGSSGKQPLTELRRKTHYDELTGLMARPRFEDALSKAVRGRRSTDTGLALVLVDIDEMGVVNDAYGHEVGDEVLAMIADILRRHIREADMAARLDGDKFALLLSAVDDVRMVMGRTEELLQAIWQPLEVQGNRLQVNANMGIAMYPNQAIDPETLIRLATDALERAKKDKRKNVIIADTVPHNVGTRPATATKH